MATAEPFLAGELHLMSKLLECVCTSFHSVFSKVGIILFSMLPILNLSSYCRIFKRVVKNNSFRYSTNINTKNLAEELVTKAGCWRIFLNANLKKQRAR